MNRRCTAVVFASVVALAALVGLAWAANVEEELKKLETDRAAAAVKGDVATLEKQTSDDYTFINLYGQMSDKSQMVNNFKTGRTKLTSNEVSDMKVRVYGIEARFRNEGTVHEAPQGTIEVRNLFGSVVATGTLPVRNVLPGVVRRIG